MKTKPKSLDRPWNSHSIANETLCWAEAAITRLEACRKENFARYVTGNATRIDASAMITIQASELPQIRDLCKTFGVSTPRASTMVSQLVRKGFAVKKESLQDGRMCHVSLTPLGLEIVKQALRAEDEARKDCLRRSSLEKIADEAEERAACSTFRS